ncbi:MAG TPA: hypothetical protein VFH27_16730 [Longimicrobiaceae bacterium]|nr:hypothetical protein [Longimicrobiaceae bacterium]
MDQAPTHRTTLALLGIPVVLTADDAALLDAAASAYAAWRDCDAGGDEPPIHVALRSGPAAAGSAPLEVRVHEPRLTIRGAGVDGEADALLRRARCTVPPELADDPARLAAEVLDTLALFLLTRAGRIPIHAAGVVIDGVAVVLAGPSGTGKSTLALTASRAGWPVLSDDTVYVQLAPVFRVWGFPRPIHVFPADAGRDAPADGAMRLRSGRWKAAIPLTGPPAGLAADRAVLCLLERGDAIALHPVAAEDAVRRMDAMLEPGFDDFRSALPAAVRALAGAGAWRLTLSTVPGEALAALEAAVRGGLPA